MLIKGAVLVILVLAAFFFLGLKMSESITDPGVRGFFFALFFLSIFTVFNIVLSFYFIIKLQGKKGPPGKKGMDGGIGGTGENGDCKDSCRKKTIELMIRNKIEDELVETGGLGENDNKVLCAIFKNLGNQLDDYKLEKLKKIRDNLDKIKYQNNSEGRNLINTDSNIFVYIKKILPSELELSESYLEGIENC